MADVMTGLKILYRHDPDGDVCAEHDVIYAGADADKDDLTEDETEQLDEAGWFWDDDNASWAVFV